ncbi:hypothetical protein [Schleiferilactobacillus harbinensis]|uniref:hypothetical protein n=1 Tax=Schleiferilactobacillus harbinensis TaxID=304207 RepID=UPI0039E7FC1B
MDLVVNGQLASEHNLILDDYPDIPQAEHSWTTTRAPGADSSLYQDNGYQDIKWTVSLSMADFDNIYIKSVMAMNWIKAAKTVSLDLWPFQFNVKTVDITQSSNEWGVTQSIKAEFMLESFKYLKNDPIIRLVNGANQSNYGVMPAKPLWKITGTDAGSLEVNDQVLKVVNLSGDLVIDSKLMIANHENWISGPYPILDQDINRISWDGGIQAVTILEGRWRSE